MNALLTKIRSPINLQKQYFNVLISFFVGYVNLGKNLRNVQFYHSEKLCELFNVTK